MSTPISQENSDSNYIQLGYDLSSSSPQYKILEENNCILKSVNCVFFEELGLGLIIVGPSGKGINYREALLTTFIKLLATLKQYNFTLEWK